MDLLVQTIRVFSEDIVMEYGIEKCSMLVIEKRKVGKSVGMELPDSKFIKSLRKAKVISILEL